MPILQTVVKTNARKCKEMRNYIKQIFLIALFITSCFWVNAKQLQITGYVKYQGSLMSEIPVIVEYFGKDSLTLTDKYGYYHFSLDVPFTSGNVTVKTLNCINDTVSEQEYFPAHSSIITSSFNLCKTIHEVFLTGKIYRKNVPIHHTKVEFSLNNFNTILEQTNTDVNGEYATKMSVGPNITGKISARVKDCLGGYSMVTTSFTKNDTVDLTLNTCKEPTTTLIAGQLKNDKRNLTEGEIKVLLYQLDYKLNKLVLKDSCTTKRGGAYRFYVNDFENNLIKFIPNSKYTGLYPMYVDSSLFWNKQGVVNVDNKNSFIRQDHVLPQRGSVIGVTSVKGKVLKEDQEELSINNAPILLLDSNLEVAYFTFLKANGEYEFNNVAKGTYKVWLDDPGKIMTAIDIETDGVKQLIEVENLIVNKKGIGPRSTVSVNDLTRSNELSIYPNPFSTSLAFDFKQVDRIKVELRTFTGAIVKEVELSQGQEIDTSDLPKGVYFVTIEFNKNTYIKKLMKH